MNNKERVLHIFPEVTNLYKEDVVVGLINRRNIRSFHELKIHTPSVLAQLIQWNPMEIRWVENPSWKLIKMALLQKADVIEYIKQSRRACREAVENDPKIIRLIRNPQPDIIELALKMDPTCIQYIKNPKFKIVKLAVFNAIHGMERSEEILRFINLERLTPTQLQEIKILLM